MSIGIKAIEYVLPEKILTNEELKLIYDDWTADKIFTKTGIKSRHVVSENENASDLAEKAVNKLFASGVIKPEEIDFILLATQSPDYQLPTTACILQDKLGIPKTSGALDFNLGCSGFVYGLALAKGLISIGAATNVLFITSETYSKHIHYKDKGNKTIFGDAAAATLISSTGFAEIQDFSLGTDGRGANNLIVKSGGFRNKFPINDISLDSSDNPVSSDYLYMNGSEIFNFTSEAVPILINDVLEKTI